MKTALITGITGQDGSFLAEFLLEKGYDVHGTIRRSSVDYRERIAHLAILHVLQCAFLIFHDFQFSCHIPRPTVDISKFSTFFSFPRHISRPKVCISHFL